jgi:hypothetical protein
VEVILRPLPPYQYPCTLVIYTALEYTDTSILTGDVRVSRASGGTNLSCHPLKYANVALTLKGTDPAFTGMVI